MQMTVKWIPGVIIPNYFKPLLRTKMVHIIYH